VIRTSVATLCFASVLPLGCEFVSSDAAAVEAGPVTDESDDLGALPAPWIEMWRDDFEGARGTAPDPTKWTPEVTPRPANNELEYYTDRRDNSFLDGRGHLVIQAIHENYLGSSQPYTSGRLNTSRLFETTYGRFEARIRLPLGTGLWPAFWLLGANFPTVGWPACGEIDVLEEAGSHPTVAHGTAIGSNAMYATSTYTVPRGNLVDEFHLFALEWGPDTLKWFVDDMMYESHTKDELVRAGVPWTFDHPFYMILNLAVGGTYDGPPAAGTVFPAQMFVDRVVVGRMPGLDGAPPPDVATEASAEPTDASADAQRGALDDAGVLDASE
jgi:beta-glucanase (GH16 family)